MLQHGAAAFSPLGLQYGGKHASHVWTCTTASMLPPSLHCHCLQSYHANTFVSHCASDTGENPRAFRVNRVLTAGTIGAITRDDGTTAATDDAVDNDRDGIIGDTFGEGCTKIHFACQVDAAVKALAVAITRTCIRQDAFSCTFTVVLHWGREGYCGLQATL
jgi:hypothetical protein